MMGEVLESQVAYFSYGFSYVMICFFCVALFLAMNTQINRNFGSRREIILMRILIFASIIETVGIGLDKAKETGLIAFPLWCSWLVNDLDLMGTLTVCYFWFRLIDHKSSLQFFKTRRMSLLMLLPWAVTAFFILTSCFSGLVFYMDADENYVRGPLYVFHIFGCYFYYLVSIAICFLSYRRGSVAERDLFSSLFAYSLFPILGGIMQILIGIVPFTTATMLISIFYTFILFQNQRINTDAMTGLNNKLSIMQYIERVTHQAEFDPYLLFMMDVNRFKSINDTYGHLVGDQALIVVAEALRRTMHQFGGFVGRYGGDEFTAIIHARLILAPDGFEGQINMRIQKILMRKGLDLPLTISAGYTTADKSGENVDDVIARADAMLYEKKRQRKLARVDDMMEKT